MQVSVETTSSIERRLTIGVPAEKVDAAVNEKLKDAAKRVRIDGFRPGKAPLKVIKQRYGAGIRQEVLGDVMNEAYFQALQQEKIDAAGYPEIEPRVNEEGKDFEFIATLEVYPKIDLGDFSTISVEKPQTELTEDDVQESLKVLREQAATWEDVEKAAEDGDQVVLSYKGMKDGEAFEGGSAENSSLVIGSGRMIPGFEDALVGMKAGEEKTAQLTFPEDYHAEELKGAAVEFEMSVKAVQEQKLPEMDDEFFARFDIKEGGEEAFMAKLRENMQKSIEQRTKDEVKRQVMDGLIDIHEFAVPKALVNSEIQALRQQSVQRFGGMANNADMDFTKMLPDELFSEEAQRRVQLGLVVATITTEKEIKVDEARVDSTIEEMAQNYQDPDQLREYYKQDQARSTIRSMVMEDMVVETVLEQAKQSDKAMSYQELMQSGQQPGM